MSPTVVPARAAPWRRPGLPTVADAMVTHVKRSGPGATVGELRRLFRDDHVHVAVVVDCGALLAVVDRADVAVAVAAGVPDDVPAVGLGTCHGRVVAPDVALEQARQALSASGRRRLAVVGPDGELLGLLCLKRTRLGFCSDRDVRARASSHLAVGGMLPA